MKFANIKELIRSTAWMAGVLVFLIMAWAKYMRGQKEHALGMALASGVYLITGLIVRKVRKKNTKTYAH